MTEDTSSNKPIGIVTDRDICCRAVAEGKNPLDLTAGDVMTGNVITVTPDMTVEECCNIMEDNQIRRVAVVDNSGACCGIVAQADIAVNADQRKTAEVVQEVSRAGA
jgi:CBS domain-containing protein